MHITKYHHACVALEDQGQKVIIDPGDRSPSFGSLENISVIVITHIHPDHFYPEHLEKIIDRSPETHIFTTQEVSRAFQNPRVTVVKNGDEHTVGPFTLHFTGDLHAGVHPDWPTTVQNVGVRINDLFYYGGDSFTPPDQPIKVLAVPVSYAWAKMDMILDFVANVQPSLCFPTHNDQLSETGNAIANEWITKMCKRNGIDFAPLVSNDFLDV